MPGGNLLCLHGSARPIGRLGLAWRLILATLLSLTFLLRSLSNHFACSILSSRILSFRSASFCICYPSSAHSTICPSGFFEA
ncbi:hypothetical protein BDY21DRAFT_330888 [Lineolata rhizophorae]|uniref:Uncharacterized protein n=1 Tax=Lineolata rhizophorae TaxID=578093 RepID=A0A6A6PE27_9PEZI|nr:hypothetical protein BDY21DRAFT_330888 [Lineolata rhizophorae]